MHLWRFGTYKFRPPTSWNEGIPPKIGFVDRKSEKKLGGMSLIIYINDSSAQRRWRMVIHMSGTEKKKNGTSPI